MKVLLIVARILIFVVSPTLLTLVPDVELGDYMSRCKLNEWAFFHTEIVQACQLRWDSISFCLNFSLIDRTQGALYRPCRGVYCAFKVQGRSLNPSGASSVIVGHPMDTVKTRLQAGTGYQNTLNCILTMYKKESVTGFFKGMSFPLASIAVYSSVVFGVFSNTQKFLIQYRYEESDDSGSLSDLLLASMVSGVASVGLGGPVDLIKIRLQMQTEPFHKVNPHLKLRPKDLWNQPMYQGPIHCITSIVQKEGFVGLYRGANAMLLRDVPGYCLFFIPYAIINDWISPDSDTTANAFTVCMAGGIAGAISWGTATPMDVVKSRLQADGVYSNKYKGVMDCISQSYQKEGFKVFFKGFTMNTIRGFPMSAATFLGYELSLQILKGDQTETNP
ncbi:solute carrier family 25 member 48 [Trichosurus vulpecula]|uniref:solute carrier family 25 member 48 n=1 Tax=Trichosurus vulpecula TaxID=9337 RepID=UPI00186B1E81|nr:solute carrier family 25 member 48 [Trichosurus vulpecula]